MDFKLTGHIYVEKTFDEATTPEDAVAAFEDKYGQLPDTVDDKTLIGRCTTCSALILDGDHYGSGEDGTVSCMGCSDPVEEEEEASDEAPFFLC